MCSVVGEVTYGGVGLGNTVFEIDPMTVNASSIEPEVLRAFLEK